MRALPTIAIAMGDPAGIGPELMVKVLADARLHTRCRAFIIGDLAVLREQAATLGSDLRFRPIKNLDAASFQPGCLDVLNPPGFALGARLPAAVHPQLGAAAAHYLQLAYELAMQSRADGVVMAPMNKESFRAAGYDYADELAFLADITGCPEPYILGAVRDIWAVAVTEHVALRQVADFITRPRVRDKIKALDSVLRRLGKRQPRIACAALNPHAGEGGLFGCEEIDAIAPAIADAAELGIAVSGPVPADIVFKRALGGEFDGVVCMYHDQMNIARKLQARGDIATLWMGLPVIGATTAHGTAFDIAGRGIADPGSLRAALEYAIRLA
ncbi:MAG: 4-hydroxythreonine-4-phosphate dehydrogenase PdxA [Chloroflexi bacterium]|nr:4-hydroxythreonine-4-phosphate dehydrogenase PdxA [Chloroflexota bacterium]MCY3581591.1 4-hydroxythreonine-4-phosphate dehydrogenase PdxA [Chloroflexota bacterium]MCY3716592.1 4-hydroxythreonine-4-phosphate dehydrogenase PdxA [Chloroflexota bacterium]MDE2649823.1 4-hydroxythreonine-4-phosphate dehydrogenase PdxA [Chloroflexota bacterium]